VRANTDGAIVNEVLVTNRFIVAVLEAGSVVTAVEKLEGVVIEEVCGRYGETKIDGVEMVEDRLIAAVNGAVAFVRDDEVVVTGREPLDRETSCQSRSRSGSERPCRLLRLENCEYRLGSLQETPRSTADSPMTIRRGATGGRSSADECGAPIS